MAFITLIISNLCLILTNRSWSKLILTSLKEPNRALFWVLGGALVFLGSIVFVPPLQALFHFAPMHSIDILIALGAGIASILWFELVKMISRIKNIELLKEKVQ